MGKSDEVKKIDRAISARSGTADHFMFVNLAEYQSDAQLERDVFESDRVRLWLGSETQLYLLFDGLDECRLRIETVAQLILRKLRSFPIERIHVRIACRIAEWPKLLEEGLKDLFGEEVPQFYSLGQLRSVDVEHAAERHGYDPDRFLQAVVERKVVPLAVKPVTLKMLLNQFRNGTLPSDRSDLYTSGCLSLCEESNESRRAARQVGAFDADHRLAVASRVAAQTLFAQHVGIWMDIDLGNIPPGYLSVARIRGRRETARAVSFEVTEAAVRETLDTGLFTGLDEDRLIFAQRTYTEFLAANYLRSRNVDVQTIQSLMTSAGDPDRRIVPELRGVASWIVQLIPSARDWIIGSDPDLLIRDDLVPPSGAIREAVTRSHLSQYEGGGRVKDWSLFPHYGNLLYPGLADQLRVYIASDGHHEIAREVAIEIARANELAGLEEPLLELVLDQNTPISLRVTAAHAVESLADVGRRARLKPLLMQDLEEDTSDELRAGLLKSLWPEHLTIDELFSVLTPPKYHVLIGGYRLFPSMHVAEAIGPEDLPNALDGVAKLVRRRDLPRPKADAADAILFKAFENLEIPGVVPALARALITILPGDRDLARGRSKDSILGDEIIPEITEIHRRALTAAIVKAIPDRDWRVVMLYSSRPRLVERDDFAWLIDNLRGAETDTEKWGWVELIRRGFNVDDSVQSSLVLEACAWSAELAEMMRPWTEPIEIASATAQSLRHKLEEDAEMEREFAAETSVVEEADGGSTPQPLAEQISLRVDAVLTGDLQKYVEIDHWLIRHSQQLLSVDLTESWGWLMLTPTLHARIVDAAKKYVTESRIDDGWFRSRELHFPSLAAVRALALLQQIQPECVEELSTDVWSQWVPAILNHPGPGAGDPRYMDLYPGLFCRARTEAPDTFLAYFRRAVEADVASAEYALVIVERAEACWDEAILAILIDVLHAGNASPNGFRLLLTALLKHEEPAAVEFAVSRVVGMAEDPPVQTQRAIAAAMLLMYGPTDIWDTVWGQLVASEDFAREVLRWIAREESRFESKFAPDQIAELYRRTLFLFPPAEQIEEINFGRTDAAVRFRDRLPTHLAERGTAEACEVLERMVRDHPEIGWLSFVLTDAYARRWRNAWQPVKPEELLDLVLDSDRRLVRDADELSNAVIASLDRLSHYLHGETPINYLLWNGLGAEATHKDENHFSDFVKWFLEIDLVGRGIVLNREVELRRGQGGRGGERTDIHVDAVVRSTNGERYDTITVIIEVKGSWHGEWDSAMQSQLRDRYLFEGPTTHGIYLVGWFGNPAARAPANTPRGLTIDDMRTQLEQQADALSTGRYRLRSYVLDASLL